MIKPISKKKYYETISEQIQQAIMSGEWPEGSRVPTEDELAKVFMVGRGSIREAITSLQMSGVLVSSPGTGTYVSENAVACINSARLADMLNDSDNINELIEARYIIEPQLTALAAKNATSQDIERMQTQLDKMKNAETAEERVHCGHLFSLAVSETCRNRILTSLYKAVAEPIRKVRKDDFLNAENAESYTAVYQSIMDAIAAKNAALAEEKMRNHLKNIYQDNYNQQA